MKPSFRTLLLVSLVCLPLAAPAQDTPADEELKKVVTEVVTEKNPINTKLDPSKKGMKIEESEVGPMNVYSRIQALDAVLGSAGIDWNAVYREMVMDVDSSAYNDVDGSVPFLIGVRIADGIFAMRNQDTKALSAAADDIKDFAKKLKVSDADLAEAEEARNLANNGKWMHVIAQLGFIQMKVIEQLRKAQPDQRRLVILGGWIQAARITGRGITSAKITDKMKADPKFFDPSYTLRDPLLTDALIDMVNKLGTKAQATPQVKAMKIHLPKVKTIVDLPIDPKDPGAKISKEKIEELISMASEVLNASISNKK